MRRMFNVSFDEENETKDTVEWYVVIKLYPS